MALRFVEIDDPELRTLFEVYAALALGIRYNSSTGTDEDGVDRGPDPGNGGMATELPVAWFEKIALLLLAADLERQGWFVRLSVRPDHLTAADPGGVDWARAVRAVQVRARAFGLGEGRLRQAAYRETEVAHEERGALRDQLWDFVRARVAEDRQYRYDGIWHDDGGCVDLLARRGAEVLLVEAKGITLKGTAVNWSVASRDTISVAERRVGTAELPNATRGILVPDDRAESERGFVATLLLIWPPDRPDDETVPVFLVRTDGTIEHTTVAQLRASAAS
jgi:hypothetical protein